jgi:hypothetical protein
MKYRGPLGGQKHSTEIPSVTTAGRCGWCGREWKIEDYRLLTDSEGEFVDVGFTIGSDGDLLQLCARCTALLDSFEAHVKRPHDAKSDA